MAANLPILASEFLIRGAILLALLWIMIRLQKLDYKFPGLIGSAALAGGLDMVPYFGHFLAVPVLYFCIWKITRSPIFTDAIITVVTSYALMFCINFFALTALMNHFRPVTEVANEAENLPQINSTNSVSITKADKIIPLTATNLVQTVDEKETAEIAGKFLIKGVTRNGGQSTVTLQSGNKIYVISLNQPISVQTDDGPVSVSLTDLSKDWVILNIKGMQVTCPIPLR